MASTATVSTRASALPDSLIHSLAVVLKDYTGNSTHRPPRLSEEQINRISELLAQGGKIAWSRIPRIYAVLHMINKVADIEAFERARVSDLWFPFTIRTLPHDFQPSDQYAFIEFQNFVLTKALDLEREDGKHRHFANSKEIPLVKQEELGKGGIGSVDRVLSTITYREYARKLIPRGKTFKSNVSMLRDFERELGHLKKLRHEHIVQLIGSYTDPKYVGLLTAPVADSNLKEFLVAETLTAAQRSLLRTFYGCLATAVEYLHENRVRHKDIKPQNILVKGPQVFLTDFGISFDWSDRRQSTTTGPSTGRTVKYCAPEVGGDLSRNTLADMWSLGCVFLEMWTILKKETIADLNRYLETSGSGSACYYLNLDGVEAWCGHLLEKGTAPYENEPYAWIQGTLQYNQSLRWTSKTLVTKITEANEIDENPLLFMGNCCSYRDDDSIISHGTVKGSSHMLEETSVSSIGPYEPELKASTHTAHEISLSGQALGLDADNLMQSTHLQHFNLSNNDQSLTQLTLAAQVTAPIKQIVSGLPIEDGILAATLDPSQTELHNQMAISTGPSHEERLDNLDARKLPSELSSQIGTRTAFMDETYANPLFQRIQHKYNREQPSLQEQTEEGNIARPDNLEDIDPPNIAPNQMLQTHIEKDAAYSDTLHSPDRLGILRRKPVSPGSAEQDAKPQGPAQSQVDRKMQSLLYGTKVSLNRSIVSLPERTVNISLSWKVSTPLSHVRSVSATTAFSPESRMLVSATYDSTIQTWNVAQAEPCDLFSNKSTKVSSAAISPDTSLVAWGFENGDLLLSHIATKLYRWSYINVHSPITALAFASDGSFVVSGHRDGLTLTLNVARYALGSDYAFHGHTSEISKVIVSPDRQLVASAAVNGVVRIWDIRRKRFLLYFTCDPQHDKSIMFCSSSTIASCNSNGEICLWNPRTGGKDRRLTNCGYLARCPLASSHDGKMIATVNYYNSGILNIYNVENRTIIAQIEICTFRKLDTLVFSPNSQVLAGTSKSGEVELWEVEPTKKPRAFDKVLKFFFGRTAV